MAGAEAREHGARLLWTRSVRENLMLSCIRSASSGIFLPVSMKKILFITDFFGPDPGGMENFNTGLVHGESGIVVLVTASTTLSDSRRVEAFDANLHLPIYRLPVPVPSFLVPAAGRSRDHVDRFEQILERERPDHILVGNLFGRTAGLLALIHRSGIPFSVILQPFDFDHLGLFHIRMHRFLKRARSVFVFSNYFLDLAMVKGIRGENLVSIPFGLPVRWDRRLVRRAKSDVIDGLKRFENRFRILSMGPLTRDKNLERIFHVIEALDAMGVSRTRYVWLIGGSGPEHGYLREMITLRGLEDTVFLAGFLQDVEVGALYYFSDIYFHPGGSVGNQASGYSASLLEAGFTSLPIVSGTGAGVEDIVHHNETGFRHGPDDYAGMARSIVTLMNDPELRRRLGGSAEERVVTEFSIDRARHQIMQRL